MVRSSFAETIWKADPAVPGDWFTAANWTAGVPGSGSAQISNGGEAQIGTGTARSYSLYLGYASSDVGTLRVSGGSLDLGYAWYAGYSGTGNIVQSGGTIKTGYSMSYLGLNAGSRGTYEMSGGTLTLQQLTLGASGSGQFDQSGGMVNLNGTSSPGMVLGDRVGSSGNYQLGGTGQLTARDVIIGRSGTGLLTQTAGTHTLSGTLTLGAAPQSYGDQPGSGAYELSGGNLTAISELVGGGGGSGSFMHSGGVNKITGTLEVGTKSVGTYALSGTGQLTATTQVIGGSSTSGLFQQTGGSNTVGTLRIYSKGRYELGSGAMQINTAIDMQGGSLAITGPSSLSVASGMVDFASAVQLKTDQLSFTGGESTLVVLPKGFDVSSGFASFLNEGVTHTSGSTLKIPVGKTTSASGTIGDPVIVAGTLKGSNGALWLNNGALVSGTLSLNGGILTVEDTTSGITGGQIASGTQRIGYAGIGTFTQTSGSNDLGISGGLYLGYLTGSSGTYKLQSGQLKAGTEYIGYSGSGLFEQSGGSNTMTSLVIGKAGRYRLSGGEMSISGSLIADGAFEIGGPASLAVGGGIVNFARGSSAGLNQLTFSGGTGALVILPQGSDPATLFASYSNSGMTHFAGATLTIPAGKTITGAGTIDDHVELAGSLLASSGGAINLNKGVSLSGSASLNAGNGTIVVDDTTSGMSGGQLTNGSYSPFYLGRSAEGSFAHSGGTVTTGKLYLGAGSGIVGSYSLSGTAQLNVTEAHIGETSTGRFVQDGGSSSLQSNYAYLGYSAGASGSYELKSGTFKAYTTYVGYNGTGEFTQSGGTNTSSVYVGYSAGSRGTYTLSDGTISGGVIAGAANASGAFAHTGGTVNGSVTVETLGSYSLSGSGVITASSGNVSGVFEHSAGTHSISGSLSVRGGAPDSMYHLSGTGSLSAQSETIYGESSAKPARFVQDGGTNTIAGTLNVGSYSNLGIYDLSAGQLSAGDEVVYGSILHRGGANTVSNLTIKSRGTYTMSGGTLTINGSLSNEGTLDLRGGQADFAMNGGILDLSRGKLVSASALALRGSENSLMILPAGCDPAATFRSFDNSGLTHVRGNMLTIPAGRSIAGSGTIDDFARIAGSLTAPANGSLSFRAGLWVSGTGSVDLGAGNLLVNNGDSGIDGGQIKGGAMNIGNSSAGAFAQSGGQVAFDYQYVGDGKSGVYRLADGTLSVKHLAVGGTQLGLLEQSGGSISAGDLRISKNGLYRLAAGSLRVSDGLDNQGLLEVGGPASFEVAGGLLNLTRGQIVNPEQLSVSVAAGSLVIVPAGFDPAVRFASFSNAGRVHTAGNTLAIVAGEKLTLRGQIDDHVELAGSLNPTPGSSLTLSKGLSLSGNASASMSNLSIDNVVSGMSGGTLSTTMMWVGDRGDGVFSHSAGNATASQLFLGYRPGSNGTYALSGGQLTALNTLTIGCAGSGRFTQTGGKAGGTGSSGRVVLGDLAGSSGAYVLSGGTLNPANLVVGSSGAGQFVHSGGTVTFSYGGGYSANIILADLWGSTGAYEISGSAQLNASGLTVGGAGAGRFIQNGGTVALGSSSYGSYFGSLKVARDGSGSGSYLLAGGSLSAGSADIGYGGKGTFVQSGGSATFSTLSVPGSYLVTGTFGSHPITTQHGSYQLTGGELTATTENVGYNAAGGLFQQSGGTNHAGTLSIGSQGAYELTGGTLEVSRSLDNAGLFDGGSSRASINIGGGIANFSRGAFRNVGQLEITGAQNALIIFPAGFDPSSGLRSFNNAGITHIRGNTLIIPAGRTVSGSGTIDDHVEVAGTISAAALNLNGGLRVQSGATVTLGDTVTVDEPDSGNNGGQFSATTLVVGSRRTGRFEHSAGTTSGQSLTLADLEGSSGTYVLSGGQLSADRQTIGNYGSALFRQTAGSNTAKRMTVNAASRYELLGGSLQISESLDSTGTFDLGDGTATFSAPSGIVNFASGTLLGGSKASIIGGDSSLIILPAGSNPQTQFANVTSTGIVHVAGSALTIPAGKSIVGSGTIVDHVNLAGSLSKAWDWITLKGGVSISGQGMLYTSTVEIDDVGSGISGGQLSLGPLTVGSKGKGVFTQTGGRATVNQLMIGQAAGADGSYSLAGGQLSATQVEVGVLGKGSFSQSGGSHAMTNLTIRGSYDLSGGSLSGDYEYIGSSTGASFRQSGGTNAMSYSLRLASSSSEQARYQLSGGSLNAQVESIGYLGTGTFEHTGGTNLATSAVYVGDSAGASGTYRLSGSGELSAGAVSIAYDAASSGLFEQSGGTSSVNSLSIGKGGKYILSGGMLRINGGLTNNGILDFTDTGTGTISTGGILSLARGDIRNLAHVSISGDRDALIIVPADPATIFASFANAGMTHIAGNTLAIGADRRISGLGTIDDHVVVAGSLEAFAGSINLTKGLSVSGSGSVNLDDGTLTVENDISGVSGGRLSAFQIIVGDSGSGTFRQSGGTVAGAFSLSLGEQSGSAGTYSLSGGLLSARNVVVGGAGIGVFDQSGGVNLAGSVSVSPQGRYVLSGGVLQVAGSMTVDGEFDFANASSTLAAGTAVIDLGHASLGNMSNASLSLGPNSLLILPEGFDPAAHFKRFSTQGLVRAAGPLVFAAGESFGGEGTLRYHVKTAGNIDGSLTLADGIEVLGNGSVNLSTGKIIVADAISGISGGQVSAGWTYVQNQTATALFRHTGGNATLYTLRIGDAAGQGGRYEISGGSLTVGQSYGSGQAFNVGSSGTGSMIQSGGLVRVVNRMYYSSDTVALGGEAGGVGSYVLSDGTLLVGGIETIGGSGRGTFTQTGGTHIAEVELVAGKPGSQGLYLHSGGTHSVRSLYISGGPSLGQDGGDGRYELSGSATLTVSESLSLGRSTGSVGTFVQKGGTLSISNTEVIGAYAGNGEGRFVQTGGAHFSQSIRISSGSLTISGGTLETGSIAIHPNPGATSAMSIDGEASVRIRDALTVEGGSFAWNAGQFSTDALTLDGGTMELSGGEKVLKLSSLRIRNGGRLDLADDAMIVRADAGSREAVLEFIAAQIGTARNAEEPWHGPGITSSAAGDDSSGLYGLAAILNADAQGKPIYSFFENEAVDANSVLVKYTLNGDADLNGMLDGSDYFFIDKGFLSRNSANATGGYRNGDFDYNGTIDGSDYFLIDKAYLATHTAGAAAPSTVVPEPGTLWLVLAAAALMLPRRRKICLADNRGMFRRSRRT